MPFGSVNPDDLDGEELDAWYRRSPADIEQARQSAAQQAYNQYFYGSDDGNSPQTTSSQEAFGSFAGVGTSGPEAGAPQLKASPAVSEQRPQLVPVAAKSQSAMPGQTPLPPGTPPLPSFISALFGGPVPLHGPGGRVEGYYDHGAAKAGLGAAATFSAIAPLFLPVGADAAPLEAGTPVTNAVRDAINEAVEMHHPVPKFMGGAADQELAALRQSLHREFHRTFHGALKDAGFPNVGGTSGSTRVWTDYFSRNPGAYDKAVEILRRTSQQFDRLHGTSVSKKLDDVLGASRSPGP